MIAGVPGAGISAFFYLLAVLAMPFVAAYRAVRAGSLSAGRWRLVGRQVALAGGIALGLLIGGAAVTWLVASGTPAATFEQTAHLAGRLGETLSRLGMALGLFTLVLVLGSVQVASVLLRWQHRQRALAAGSRQRTGR